MDCKITNKAEFVCDSQQQGATLFYSKTHDCYFSIDHENGDAVSRHERLVAVKLNAVAWEDVDHFGIVACDLSPTVDLVYLDGATLGEDPASDLPDGVEVLWDSAAEEE